MNLPNSLARMRQFAPLMLVLASAAVALAAYLQAIDYTFISDDIVYITNNSKLAGLQLAEQKKIRNAPNPSPMGLGLLRIS